jgi:hypothetical protein
MDLQDRLVYHMTAKRKWMSANAPSPDVIREKSIITQVTGKFQL